MASLVGSHEYDWNENAFSFAICLIFLFFLKTIFEHCMNGKQTRLPHKKSCGKQKIEPLQLVHSDVCGPMPIVSLGSAMYFVTFNDEAVNGGGGSR